MTDFATTRRILQAKRLMDHQGVTRKARPRHCRRCGAAVLAAIDTSGFTVAVDPTPLTAAGEALAILSGLGTWARWGEELDSRRHWNMSAHPDDIDVFRKHRCGNAAPEYNEKRRQRLFTGRSLKEVYSGEIPF